MPAGRSNRMDSMNTGSEQRQSLCVQTINVAIGDYLNSTGVSETRLMNLVTDMIESYSYKLDQNKVSIGGIPVIITQVQDSESFAPYSVAAYSPDGYGKEGNTIALIESFQSRDVTNSFLKDFKFREGNFNSKKNPLHPILACDNRLRNFFVRQNFLSPLICCDTFKTLELLFFL